MVTIGTYTYEEYLQIIESFHGSVAPGLLLGGFMVDLAVSSMPEGVLFDSISISQESRGGDEHVIPSGLGKDKKTEEILGVELIVQSGSKRDGYQLSETGRSFMEKYLQWFDEVEQIALIKAKEMLPWDVESYRLKSKGHAK